MSHVRQQIREAVATAVTGLATTGARVFQSYVYPLDCSQVPGLIIYSGSESEPERVNIHDWEEERQYEVIVEARCKANDDTDDTLDTILAEVAVALFGTYATGRYLSGLVTSLKRGALDAPDYSGEQDKPVARLAIPWLVTYHVHANAPTTAL